MRLRHATDADVYRVYRWKMDKEAKRWFASRRIGITWKEHLAWFSEHVTQEHYYIGEEPLRCPTYTEYGLLTPVRIEVTPVGAVRIEPDASGCLWVSIVLAPEHRGHGYGTAMLKALPAKCAPLWAQIHNLNIPSLKTFERAGFAQVGREDQWCIFRRN